MRKPNLDKNGIPVMTRTDIEERTESFLRFFDADCLDRPKFSPLDTICCRLSEEFEVKFIFDAELGDSPEGYKYRGRFHIPSKTIFIDNSLPIGSPPFNFTLAHELAHFVLHRKIDRKIITSEKDDQISDTKRQLILDHLQSNNPKEIMEWQANKFASSLLLPRLTVPIAVVKKQQEIGINRRLGFIFLDDQPRNKDDFSKIMEHLGCIYMASKTAIRYRLRELNILIEGQKRVNPLKAQGVTLARDAL